LEGEIVLVLDEGRRKGVGGVENGRERNETVMRAGDICVQRGTMHAWTNRSDANARMLFVLLPSEKVRLETGEELEATEYAKAPDS
jgi:uncharacterized cupin superfamily protein